MTEATPDVQPEPDDAGNAVTVAYVNSNTVTYAWHHSMIQMLGWDLANHGRLLRGGYVGIRYGSDGLAEARNLAVKEFLDDRAGDWLFWVDTDMGFAPDTVDRLLDAAHPVDRPVVGALCFSQRETTPDGMGGWRCTATPTIFDWARVNIYDNQVVGGEQQRVKVDEQQGFAVRWDYPANTVIRCAGTGSACILIHRSVFVQVRKAMGDTWYDKVPNRSMGRIVSEDLSLCLRLGTLNIPVHVHTGVQATHQKTLWLAEEDYWRARAVDPPPVTLDQLAAAEAERSAAEQRPAEAVTVDG